jgi:hypothetical protein
VSRGDAQRSLAEAAGACGLIRDDGQEAAAIASGLQAGAGARAASRGHTSFSLYDAKTRVVVRRHLGSVQRITGRHHGVVSGIVTLIPGVELQDTERLSAARARPLDDVLSRTLRGSGRTDG